VNGQWQPVRPEPMWLDDLNVRQVISHGETVQADTRKIPDTMLILEESIDYGVFQNDKAGWGGHKYWTGTTDRHSSKRVWWQGDLPRTGRWKIFIHNPTAITSNPNGYWSHNSTRNAQVELDYGSQSTFFTFNQDAAPKGSLVEITEIEGNQGYTVGIGMSNETGETGRDISFDNIVLVWQGPLGAGGASSPTSGNSPNSSPTRTYKEGGRGCSFSGQGALNNLLPVLFVLFCLILSARLNRRRFGRV